MMFKSKKCFSIGALLVLINTAFVVWSSNEFLGSNAPQGWGFAGWYGTLLAIDWFLVRMLTPVRGLQWALLLHIFLPAWIALIQHTAILSIVFDGEFHYDVYAGAFIFLAMWGFFWSTLKVTWGEGAIWKTLRGSPLGFIAPSLAVVTICLPALYGAWFWSFTALLLATGTFFSLGQITVLRAGLRWLNGRPTRFFVIAILLVSTLFRIGAVLSLNRHIDESKPWGRSSWGYHNVAKMLLIDPAAMLRPRKWGVEIRLKGEPAAPGNEMPNLFEIKPGYGLVLGAVYRLTRPTASVGRWFNLVVSLFTLWFTFYLTSRVWNETAGVIALTLHASSSYLLWQGIYIDESTLALLCFQISVYLGIRLFGRQPRSRGLIYSLILGFALWLFTFIRPDNLYLFGPFWILLLIRYGREKIGSLVCVLLVFVALWVGWGFRNRLVYDRFILTNHTFSMEFFRGANPHFERAGVFNDEGLEGILWTMVKSPIVFTRAVLGAGVTWERFYGFFDRRGFAFWHMSFLSLFDASLYSFFFGLGVDIAMLVGIPIALRRGGWMPAALLLAIAYRATTAVLLFWVQNYRIWVEPFTLTFAACGVYWLYRKTIGGLDHDRIVVKGKSPKFGMPLKPDRTFWDE